MFYDTNSEDESISLARLPGGNVIQIYYDGQEEKQLNYELQVKVKPRNRQMVVEEMTKLTDELIMLSELESHNHSFELNKITVGNELYVAQADDGYIYFRLDFQPELLIIKE